MEPTDAERELFDEIEIKYWDFFKAVSKLYKPHCSDAVEAEKAKILDRLQMLKTAMTNNVK